MARRNTLHCTVLNGSTHCITVILVQGLVTIFYATKWPHNQITMKFKLLSFHEVYVVGPE